MNWSTTLSELPLIAILRGLVPAEAVAMAEALCGAGFRVLEVPLNSPRPLESIRLMREALGERALVGAGTVLNVQAARDVAAAGGQIVISPNADTDVIAQTKALGLISLPAFFTPT
ncbi:MAG: 2-dehydro-3-deoxy-6-phosphogalactonate aldolase, partial [Caulobacteraceae bacterium]|nr:2-dehydro-3-deoxy-6-phosphogalactonate aldolase [Caulobacteraceae bacterium]